MPKENIDLIVNIIGLLGVVIILLTYFLLQINKINSKGFIYSFANLIGSILIMISLYRFWNLSSFVIEIFWIVISIYGLISWKIRKNKLK